MSEILFIVSLITMVQDGTPVGSATGFFYLKNDVLYFVTNRHVVIDEQKGLKPDALRLRLHADANDLTKNVDRVVELYRGGKPRWHVHPKHPKVPVDIAVVQLDAKPLTSGVILKALSRSNFIPENLVINPGADLMVIGFPRDMSDTRHNLPLIRNALVSSAYGVPFEGASAFLIDANLHPGMSGSPVLTKPKNLWPDKSGSTNLMTVNCRGNAKHGPWRLSKTPALALALPLRFFTHLGLPNLAPR